jgi:hypothetical protein
MRVSIKTNNGHFWSAEEGGGLEGEMIWGRPKGLAVADRQEVGSDQERFEVRVGPEGRVGFQSQHGSWLSAQQDGTLVFNRKRSDDWQPEAWESFRIVPGVEHETYGGVAFITDHGTYVQAENEGGGALKHVSRDAPGPSETFYPSERLIGGSTGGGGVAGGGLKSQQVTVDPSGGFLLGGQPALIQGVHDGSGLSQFFYNPEECLRRDQISAEAGFHFRRTWWDVDGPYWEGRQERPHWPEGDRVLTPGKYGRDRYLDGCVAYLKQGESLGMGAHMARGTWTSTDRREMADIVRIIVEQAGSHNIVIGEALNEHDAVSPHTPIEHLTEFRERAYPGVALRCNSALGGMDIEAQAINGDRLKRYNPGASIIPFHGFRGYGWKNKLERDWNVRYDWGIGHAVSGEPMGFGEFVSAHDNMHECNGAYFQIYTALMFACGYIPVYMSSPGVIPDSHRSEPWDSSPGFYDVCKVRDWLPADAGHFRKTFHGGDRWGNDRYFRAIGDTRVEHHIEPETQRGIIIAYGNEAAHIPKHREFRIDRDEWVEEGHIKGRVIVGQGQ